MQMIKMTFAIAAVGFAVLVAGGAPAQAAPAAGVSQQLADQASGSMVQKVHYRRHGHRHRHYHYHRRHHRHHRHWR